ncbi:hypothetical protein [Paenibacillus sacheonensis]|uniref:LysM domain-containing protein n=1 Tax=Paenibacillus sacheonensis TaxID=742054 RepID=A0A7X4YQT9_9BACL|nr:hypothetical protein [Paenibacillus sacheonensis]MBM7565308.1 putative transcriptional regulator [Paenibacillus sacheonensis]NBC69921.1 hypothetical protein [Paenibacillus sacheonensis]
MNMSKTMKTLTIGAALAVMIPISAYAAASSTAAGEKSSSVTTEKGTADAPKKIQREGMRGNPVSQEVLDLLKLDAAALKEKLAAGKTLAQIAEEQGVTRDALKAAMTDAFAKRQAEEKQAFADNLDKTVDGQMKFDQGPGKGKGFEGKRGFFLSSGSLDLTATAKLLGLSADELRTQQAAGKSIADIAKEKGVDAQTIIDSVKQAIADSQAAAVKAGKLTQEQADKLTADASSIAEKLVNGKGPMGVGGKGPEGRKGGHMRIQEGASGASSEAGAASNAGSADGSGV